MLSRRLRSGTPWRLAFTTSISCGIPQEDIRQVVGHERLQLGDGLLALVASRFGLDPRQQVVQLGVFEPGNVEAFAGRAGVEIREHVRIVRDTPTS